MNRTRWITYSQKHGSCDHRHRSTSGAFSCAAKRNRAIKRSDPQHKVYDVLCHVIELVVDDQADHYLQCLLA